MIGKFAQILGPMGILREAAQMQPFLTEWRDSYTGKTSAVLMPETTAQVSAILKLAHAEGVAIVTQGGNTGLTGAQIPFEHGREFLLSLKRLNKLRVMDAASDAMVAEAGMTLAQAQAAADGVGRLFPLSLASEGSCTIGGNISTNAGGVHVLAYGNMRDLVLGLEVVLANGEVWDGLKLLRKDNSGYDLKQLFIGAEGTLGVITAAALRLFPRPKGRAVGFAGVASPEQALSLYARARDQAGLSLTALELMPRFGLGMMMAHRGLRNPLAGEHPWLVLVELSGPEDDDYYFGKLAGLLDGDATIAQSGAQAKELWAIREGMSEAQKLEGASLKHDVSVPVSALPRFLSETLAGLAAQFPDVRPLPFGHAGDGNMHFNVSQPKGMAAADFRALAPGISNLIHGMTLRFGGSIAAEHGVGRMKRELLAQVKSPVEMGLMRGLKAWLDPKGILNPGKVV